MPAIGVYCTKKGCTEENPQPLDNFWNHPKNKWCKACSKEHVRRWQEKNRGRTREYASEYYRRNKNKIIQKNRENYTPEKGRSAKLRRYKMTEDSFSGILKNQKGKCAICKKLERVRDYRTNRVRSMAVDHCHATGRVRGILCSNCNRMLGLARDSSSILASAIKYLEGQ